MTAKPLQRSGRARTPTPPPASGAPTVERTVELDHTRRLQARVAVSEYRATRQAVVLGCLADLLGEPDLQRALDRFVVALQRRFVAERVSIALIDNDDTLVIGAMSGQAIVDAASTEVQLLLDALQETLALECTVSYPEHRARPGGLPAHRALAGGRSGPAMLGVPLYHDAAPVGALLIERGAGGLSTGPFAGPTRELIEQIALAAAPLVALRREAASTALQRVRRTGRERLGALLDSARPARAAALFLVALLVVLAVVVPVERSVIAEAELVPQQRRWVMAPIDGFVEEVSVTAGEAVVAGQLLARFDRRELDLELARRDGEIDAAESELRAAMAGHDRKATAVARARLRREQAGQALIVQRIERSELRAPMDGTIISGDPSRISGVPVARGDTLFEIAPVEGYDVHLLVEETDIAHVHVGQTGELALRTAPDERFALNVRTIHPVGESGDGATRFRVRADLQARPDTPLRPGQSGTVRLQAGHERIVTRLLRPLGRRLQELRWRFFG